MIKEWTILLYLNGNNELEPEIWNSKLKLDGEVYNIDTNIVVEIGRADIELVKIIRPNEEIVELGEKWVGVRRYYINGNQSILVDELNNINMADYKELYKFLEWGITNYPAKKYMVIISGHGFLVASLSDLVGEDFYTMGAYEMLSCFQNIKNKLNVQIDLLILDICYMNSVELIYELSVNSSVRHLLTFIETGPIEGMDYSQIIKSIESNNDIDKISVSIAKEIQLDLVLIDINKSTLDKIKMLISDIGKLNLENNNSINSLNLFIEINNKEKELMTLKDSLIIYQNRVKNINEPNISILDNEIFDEDNKELFFSYYDNLSFSKNNYWRNFISGNKLEAPLNQKESEPQLHLLTQNNLYAFVRLFNPDMNYETIVEVIERLYKYKELNKNK